MMNSYPVCFCLTRILLPICLVSSIAIRPLGMSFLYLLLAFYLPFVPVPTKRTFKGHAGHYLRAVMIISITTMACQLIWQITLASLPFFISMEWLDKNELIEKILRNIDLVSYVDLDAISVIKWISPEILMFISSTAIFIIISRLCKGLPEDELQASAPKRKGGSFAVSFGKYISLLLLMISGSLRPSVLSGIYYLTFLGGATWWACGKELARGYAIVCKFIMTMIFCHILLLFSYQSEWILELLPPEGPIPRYLGFTQLITMSVNGTDDPRVFEYVSSEWPTFVSPILLIFTFYILAFESKELLRPQPEKKVGGTFAKLESGSLNGSIRRQMSMRLSRTRTARSNLTQDKWRSATRKVRVTSRINGDQVNEETPLIRAVSPTRKYLARKSNASGSICHQDSTGSVTVAPEEGIPMKDFNEPNPQPEKPSIVDHIIMGVDTVFQLMIRNSYIATAIIMIAWSITYHSWLAFVFLLWANVIWMIQDQRRFTLRSSPVLVAYALLLLIAQYFIGLNFGKDELFWESGRMGETPERRGMESGNGTRVSIKQLGFERPESFPCVPILVKSLYTIMFWVTLRQMMQEKRERRQSSAIADMVAPLQIGVAAAGKPIEEEPQPQTSQFVQKLGVIVKNFLTRFWICIVAIMLFANGISGEKMTLFRILYMALFLVFILTFQISRRIWRKMMYFFWITVIVISMTILILVYTYQFDGFNVYWEKYLHIDEKLQSDIGMERFQIKDLLIRLLVPTTFLIACVIQLHYFHNDFLAISHIKSRSSSVARQESQGAHSVASSMMGGSSLPPSTPREIKPSEFCEYESEYKISDNEQSVRMPSATTTMPSAKVHFTVWLSKVQKKVFDFLNTTMELVFLFLELHIIKIIFLSVMLLCIFDVCAIHIFFVLLISISLPLNTKAQVCTVHIISVVTSILLLSKMIYQINYIEHNSYNVTCNFPNTMIRNGSCTLPVSVIEDANIRYRTSNVTSIECSFPLDLIKGDTLRQLTFYQSIMTYQCSIANTEVPISLRNLTQNELYMNINCTTPDLTYNITFNNAKWLGFSKTKTKASAANAKDPKDESVTLPKLLKGYIGLIIVITIRAIVDFKQYIKRVESNDPTVRPYLMFPRITRSDADKNINNCLKYLFNYGFYKFGVEICLMCLVGLIGSRLDGWALLYAIWLCVLWNLPREKLSRIWRFFVLFIMIVLPFQYLLVVGMVPQMCIVYPWMEYDPKGYLEKVRDWLMLPDPTHPPHATKLICDFILLLLCSRQSLVFRIERRHGANYKGGSNADDIPENWELIEYENPVPDFITYIRSWLDMIKRITMLGSLWLTLAIMFLTGTNRVNVFSLGYLIGSFVFLWQGTDLYLRPIKSSLKWWNWLLGYNITVIFIKTFLQMFGCIFTDDINKYACWLVQLLGIGCIDKFQGGKFKFSSLNRGESIAKMECSVPPEDIGLAWDGVCFGFLLIQRRLFQSNYFLRIIDESKAIAILQSRGAELIEELRIKQMTLQDEQEKRILEKIKIKMDRIKANQLKINGPKYREPSNHFVDDASEIKSTVSILKRHGSNASCISIHTPAEGYHTPRTPSTIGSPRGYHTPISEEPSPEPTPEHLRSPPGPPSPYSALMTGSLDAYLEPQRISFGSPPSSELNPRHSPVASESYPVFSPPTERKFVRKSSMKSQSTDAQTRFHTPRFSVVSISSRSQFSHHTYDIFPSSRPTFQKVAPDSYKIAIRSGDYYMFDDFDEDEVLDLEEDRKSDDSENEIDRKLTLGQLLSSAMKTNIDEATRMRRKSLPPARQRSRLSTRSSHSFRRSITAGEDPCSSSVAPEDVRVSVDKNLEPDDDEIDGGSAHSDSLDSESQAPEEDTLWRKIVKYVLFGWAFVESLLVSLTRWLNRFSRDYRYVAKVLTREKIVLKEGPNFGKGIRAGTREIWEPLPSTLLRIGKPQDSESNEKNDQAAIEPAPESGAAGAKSRRKESEMSVPEIRIVAPSMECGLDLDSSPFRVSNRQSSIYSIQFSSDSSTPIEEYDDETFAADQPTVFRFLFAIWYAILAHTDIACYFMIFINQIQSATLLSLPLPLMVFMWGTLSIPRPSKTFWVTIIAYTEVIVIIKSLFQYEILPWNQSVIPNNMPFSAPRIIGIERKHNYALYDLILLLIVFLHRFMLISLGLWKTQRKQTAPGQQESSYPISPAQLASIKEGHGFTIGQLFAKKHTENLAIKGAEDPEEEPPPKPEEPPPIKPDSLPLQPVEEAAVETASQKGSISSKTSDNTRDSSKEEKTAIEKSIESDDLSKHDASTEEKIKTDDQQASPSDNDEDMVTPLEYPKTIRVSSVVEDYRNFPGALKSSTLKYTEPIKEFYLKIVDPTSRVRADVYAYMFMCDFFNFMVVIFGFSAFGTQQGDGGVQAYLEDNKVPIPFLVMLILQFGLIVIDRALFLRKFILGKMLFQLSLVIGVHIWMFFILPAVTERSFNALLPPPMWYMVKCIYLLLSAYQIRCGYPSRILGNFLCKSYNYVNNFLFKGFLLVPYLFELRTLMDWIWTDTAMTIWDWIKMEDVFSNVFQLKCGRYVENEYPQPRGEKKKPMMKYLLGGSALACIIALIWFPLVFFAFGNTVGESNPPYDVTINIRMGPYLPIYTMSAQSNNIKTFNEDNWNTMTNIYKKDRSAQTFFSNYVYDDVAAVIFTGNSTNIWEISPPDMERLKEDVASNVTIKMKLTYILKHKTNAKESPPVIEEEVEYDLKAYTKEYDKRTNTVKEERNPQREILNDMLNGNQTKCLTLEHMFPKFIKVFNKGSAKPVSQLMSSQRNEPLDLIYKDICLKLTIIGDAHVGGVKWWEVKETCDEGYLKHLPFADCMKLIMYSFNDKLFPATFSLISGSGIIGLYTTFVFLASRVVRGHFSGIFSKIMFEDLPYVDRVLQLCLDIYLVRETGELALEEDLFAKLVFLYRSPETMIKWTRPKGETDTEAVDDESQRAS